MIKDLSAKLVAAVTEINQKSRQAFAAEQKEIATKKAASAKMHTYMPKQPEPKADPAAVSNAKKMAEAVEGSIPKTPKEKELAAKSGDKKRITFGDVLKARGVKEEGWNPIKHIPKENQNDAIKKAAKDVKRGSYADRAALLRAGGVKEETVAEAKNEEKGEKGESAAQEKAEKKAPWPSATGPSKVMDKEKSAFTSKKISTGTVYSRKYEEVESVAVKHDQFGTGKTLPQFAEDLKWIDVMFAEGIKRVDVEELELVEEKAVHPDAIHVSDAGGGKYKVHAVGKNFAHGVKVGEHLTDTHLDDFSEMGGKVKMVKPPKKD